MLQDKRINNKTSASKECNICYYWYFWNNGFKFQPEVCNRYNDKLMMSLNLSNIGTLNIHSIDYGCIINGNSESEAINLLWNADLNEKNWSEKHCKI